MNKIGISIKCSHNFLVIIIIINKFSNYGIKIEQIQFYNATRTICNN